LFSYVDLETRVGKDHPLRTVRGVVNEALAGLSGEFSTLYSSMGRPSIPPEKLLRAMLLQAFYSIRSERQLMERLEFDLLFRWFVGMGVDGAAWDHSRFSKNRERLLEGDIAAKLLSAVLAQPRVKRLLSTDHFSVDGTLIELRSMKASPHVAQNTNGRSSAIDGRTTRHAGYAVSQRIRKRIEEAFGWMKTIGGQEKTKFRGRDRVGWAFTFAAAAYNLARLPKLLATPA
jgi:transposase